MNTLETAMFWKKAGIAVIPIRYMDKQPDARLLPKDDHGRPVWEPFQKHLPTDNDLKRWFPTDLHNLAIITGWQNLAVLDFDDLGTYLKWSLWVTRMGGFTRRVVEMTYMVRTARGIHVYFRTNQPEKNRKLPGIDIKAGGGYVLGCPSVHPSGQVYQVYQNGLPARIEALSDVLPASYLLANTELPPAIYSSVSPVSSVSDNPWDKIMHSPDPNQDLIKQIRATIKIESFFTDLKDTGDNGRWMMTTCPFHDDAHPSFWLDTQRQICGCHAGCTPKPLDVINLFARLHGLTNRDAIFHMAHRL